MADDPIRSLITAGGPVIDFIRNAIATTTLKPTPILRELRLAGLQIRTQTFFQVATYLRALAQTGRAYVQALPDETLPDTRQLNKTLTTRDTNYTYLINILGVDAETGEDKNQYVTVITNDLLSKRSAVDVALSNPSILDKYSFASISGALVVDIRTNRAGIV